MAIVENGDNGMTSETASKLIDEFVYKRLLRSGTAEYKPLL